MKSFITLATSVAAFATCAAAQCEGQGSLSCRKPAPPCLQRCLKTYDPCTACGTGRGNVESCINNACGFGPTNQGLLVTVYFQSMCASGGYLADSFVNITSSCENTNPVVPADDEWIGSRHSQHTIGDSKKVLKGHWRA